MSMKKWLLSCIAGAALLLLAACGGEEPGGADVSGNNGKEQGEETVQSATAKTEPAELVLYYPFSIWTPELFKEAFEEPLKKAFPHVTLKLISGGNINELIAANQQIDIYFSSLGAAPTRLIDTDLKYDIAPLIKQYNYDDSHIEPQYMDAGRKLTADNVLYGLPIYASPATVYYNRDIFQQFGVPFPKDDMTWDDMYEMNRRLTQNSNGVQYYGITSSFAHYGLLNQLSLPFINPATQRSTLVSNEQWKRVVDNLARFYQIPGYDTIKAADYTEPKQRALFFQERRAAMWMALTGLHHAEAEGMNWDLAPYPTYADKPGTGPQVYPNYFFVTSTSKHKEQAFEVLAYMTTPEFQMLNSREGRFLTVLKDSAVRDAFGQNVEAYKSKNVKALLPRQFADAVTVSLHDSRVQGQFNLAVRNVIAGGKDVNTALREAAEAADKLIEQEEAKR